MEASLRCFTLPTISHSTYHSLSNGISSQATASHRGNRLRRLAPRAHLSAHWNGTAFESVGTPPSVRFAQNHLSAHNKTYRKDDKRAARLITRVAKPDKTSRDGEKEDDVAEDDEMPVWITQPWEPVKGGGWWVSSDYDIVVEPVPYVPPPEHEWDENDKIAFEKKQERLKTEREAFAAGQLLVGQHKVYDNINDIRLDNHLKFTEKAWTHEEIMEFIGPYDFRAMEVQPNSWRADYQELSPSVPETHEWLAMKGMILSDEDLEEEDEDREDDEETLTQQDDALSDEFSDFDSNKVTMSDMNAMDIGGDDGEDESDGGFEDN